MSRKEREDWDRKWRLRLEDERYADERDEPNRFLVQEIEGTPPGRALDLACGAGRNAIWLAERGWTVTGIDFSAVALARARRRAAAKRVDVELVAADLREYEPPRAAFDLVLVLYLQLPAGERRGVLERAAEAVAPGGTLLVVGHHLDNLTEGWRGPQDPEVLFTAEEVARELPGLSIERAERVLRSVETEEGPRTAVDTLVRASRPRARRR